MATNKPVVVNEDGNGKDPTTEAHEFCDSMKAEQDLRAAIAEISAKLNRSNVSAVEGLRYATRLMEAYKILKKIENPEE